MSKPIDQKLLEMRNGFTAVSSAIEAIANNPLTAPDVNNILDRSLSGDKIQGGRIAQFSSAGIKDTASDYVLRVTNDGITVDTAHVNNIPNALTVGGDLTVAGEVHATRLHVDEVVADIRNETTSNLEFRAEGGSVSNKGLIWSGEGNTRQFTMQGDRLFSSHSIDLHKNQSFRIANRSVLSRTALGQEVTQSSLTTVGTLQNLSVEGDVTLDNFIYYDSETMRLGIGHDNPNGALSIGSLEHEFVVDHNDVGTFKLGTWTTSELKIITDNNTRIHIEDSGSITMHNKVSVQGKLGVNVSNFSDDADITTAGPIKMQGKKMQVGSGTPTEGSYRVGDIVWNTAPRPTGYVGWICVREGTPGEWKPFGQIAS
jgi:hypothetical protein